MASSLKGLNPRQREAVEHGEGPLLILAGAGTGKTRTLAHRIVRLVERGIAGESILAVSFTNKAADELRERVRRLLGGKGTVPPVSTFHSFCVRVLRHDIEALGYKRNFTIYDTADQLGALREVLRESKLPGRDLDLRRLLALISRGKNDGRPPGAADGSNEYAVLAAHLQPRYERALRSYNALDFDDLLLLVLRLFGERPEVLARWREVCRHLLVDEFQDTNEVQYRLVRLLAGPRGNLTVVGDDDQSIYGWRGAAPGNLLGVTRDWPGARVITLEQNYRSSGNILRAANAVIAGNRRLRAKKLWSNLGEGIPVTVLACLDGEDEAAAAVDHLLALLADGETRPGDCAIVFRTNAQSRPFEDALRAVRLRYVVAGGMRFYDRKEVRDFLAYLAAVENPRDEVALLRILNYPPRGIGRETVLHLQEESLKSGRPLAQVLAGIAAIPGIGPRQSEAVTGFLTFLDRQRERFRSGRLAEAAGELLRESGLEDEVYQSRKDGVAGMKLVENLREAVASLRAFQEAVPRAGLGEYLAAVSLSGREEEEGAEFSDQAVTLLTVHAAKGLEFPHVFFAGMEEGLLPHRRSEEEPGGLEEERRLAYVGMTRAKRSLVLSHAGARLKRDKKVPAVPSRFLEELPAEGVAHRDRRRPADHDPAEESRAAVDFFSRIRDL